MKELIPIIVASSVGSLHCVGMCGGIVSFYSGTESVQSRKGRVRWTAHAAYHLARFAAYATLGGAAGQLGSAFDGIGRHWGLAAVGSLVASTAMLLWAMSRVIGARRGQKLLQLGRARARPSRWLEVVQGRLVALALRAREKPPLWRAATMGLSSALLPCGWLYAFVVLAAGAGSPSSGAVMLTAFWVGTVPALLGLGLGIERLGRQLAAHVPRLGAVLVLSIAGWNIVTRWPGAASSASTPDPAKPSCHAQR